MHEPVAESLEQLHQNQQDGDSDEHHVGLEALVAKADGQVAETAAALGIAEGTVKRATSDAMHALRGILRPDPERRERAGRARVEPDSGVRDRGGRRPVPRNGVVARVRAGR